MLNLEQTWKLHDLLEEFHDTFSLDENDRGDADMEIRMEDAAPSEVPSHMLLALAVCQELS